MNLASLVRKTNQRSCKIRNVNHEKNIDIIHLIRLWVNNVPNTCTQKGFKNNAI